MKHKARSALDNNNKIHPHTAPQNVWRVILQEEKLHLGACVLLWAGCNRSTAVYGWNKTVQTPGTTSEHAGASMSNKGPQTPTPTTNPAAIFPSDPLLVVAKNRRQDEIGTPRSTRRQEHPARRPRAWRGEARRRGTGAGRRATTTNRTRRRPLTGRLGSSAMGSGLLDCSALASPTGAHSAWTAVPWMVSEMIFSMSGRPKLTATGWNPRARWTWLVEDRRQRWCFLLGAPSPSREFAACRGCGDENVTCRLRQPDWLVRLGGVNRHVEYSNRLQALKT